MTEWGGVAYGDPAREDWCPRCNHPLRARLALVCPDCMDRIVRTRAAWEGHADGCSAGRPPAGIQLPADSCPRCGALMEPDAS
jgi:hypothetical protein